MNAVVVTNIGKDRLFDWAGPTVEHYCRRHGLELVLITTPAFNLRREGDSYGYLNFEKNQAYDVLERYDRILRLDADILITSDCPDVFQIVPAERVGVVFEDVGAARARRCAQMERVAQSFGGAAWGERRYFNSGVVVASRRHRDMLRLTASDLQVIQTGDLGGCKEQNLLNWKVRELGFELFELDYRFNHLSQFSRRWYGHARRTGSYILHYAGNQTHKERRMRRDARAILAGWERLLGVRRQSWLARLFTRGSDSRPSPERNR